MKRQLSITETAYLAGILDGEGCISLAFRLGKYLTPTVQVTNTSLELCEWVKDLCGGSVYTRLDHRENRKTCYLWRNAGAEARDTVRLVHPFLIVKRKQAEVILRLHDEVGIGVRRKPFLTTAQLDAMQVAVSEIRLLNKKGREHAAA